MRSAEFSHRFVEFIPEVLEERTLYVSMKFATVIHKCACGCGKRVVTPLSPTDWKLLYDGRTISLTPSIGNWSFECRSHYWIRNNRASWAPSWSAEQVEAGRDQDRLSKEKYANSSQEGGSSLPSEPAIPHRDEGWFRSMVGRLRKRWL